MEITNSQYAKIKSFITPTGNSSERKSKRAGFDHGIKTKLKYTRWEDTPDKKGYAGITLSSPTKKSPANLEIIWTDDGERGYPLKLDKTTISELIDWLEAYNG